MPPAEPGSIPTVWPGTSYPLGATYDGAGTNFSLFSEVAERVVLHTGERQTAAIALYRRSGYRPIEIFAPYDQVPESLCFEKWLGATSAGPARPTT